jgi:RHS repeat-associated protein
VFFEDKNNNGCITTEDQATSQADLEIVQRLLYYPFGMALEGLGAWSAQPWQQYRYNGKERDTLTGWYDYGARWGLLGIGRWNAVDPLAGHPNQVDKSPYAFSWNNPILYFDTDGRYPIKIHVRSFAPFNYFGFGLWKGDGNNRSFSTSFDYTSRIRQVTSYETTTRTSSSQAYGAQSHSRYGANAYSDAEITYDQSYGNRIYTRLSADMDAVIPGVDYGGPTHDIDVWTDMFINTTENGDGSSTLSIRGNIAGDGFPSSEAFVSDDFGNSVFLGVGAAKAGPNKGPFIKLAGDKKEKQFGINTRIAVDKGGRFTGVYDGDNVISIGDWNKRFENQNPKGN